MAPHITIHTARLIELETAEHERDILRTENAALKREAHTSGGTHRCGEAVFIPCDCMDAEIGRQWREDSSLEKWFPLTAERLAAKERENLHLAREARTWWEAAQTYAAELERHKPLLKAVEWIIEDGHMNQEHLARMRAAWEEAYARLTAPDTAQRSNDE